MNKESLFEKLRRIQNSISKGNYRLSSHAEHEREADQITKVELDEALFSSQAEIIEDYPNDSRGPSCLILGFTSQNKPLHVVMGLLDKIIIITVYRPTPKEWTNWRERRGG
ncbi:MAG: hypothetical protein HW384_2101 [Dehalococcoidia bacterium]|nr:hypothetical protein [Dehalococcoidia bacterium]MBF8303784.1 hypothetical protein [Dehalococcoidia bacterium]